MAQPSSTFASTARLIVWDAVKMTAIIAAIGVAVMLVTTGRVDWQALGFGSGFFFLLRLGTAPRDSRIST